MFKSMLWITRGFKLASISVIVPTFNRVETLPRAINSVLDQIYQDIELWIVDDGSTDETESWVQTELLKENLPIPCHYLRSPNKGVSHARNLAISASSSPWVAFLDSDDEWLPNKLQDQMNYVEKHPDAQLVHGEEIWMRNGVRVNPMKKHQKSGGRIFDRCVELCCISPSTVMIHRDVFQAVGTFREDFPVCEDYELWLRICAKYNVGFLQNPIIKKYGGHDDQLSRKYVAMDYYRIKALEPFLNSDDIDSNEKQLVELTINKKCNVLMRGFKRHNNMDHYNEVESIARKATAQL